MGVYPKVYLILCYNIIYIPRYDLDGKDLVEVVRSVWEPTMLVTTQ